MWTDRKLKNGASSTALSWWSSALRSCLMKMVGLLLPLPFGEWKSAPKYLLNKVMPLAIVDVPHDYSMECSQCWGLVSAIKGQHEEEVVSSEKFHLAPPKSSCCLCSTYVKIISAPFSGTALGLYWYITSLYSSWKIDLKKHFCAWGQKNSGLKKTSELFYAVLVQTVTW